MRRVSFVFVLGLVGLTSVVAAEPPLAGGELPPPIPTRQTLFSIPFQIDRADHPMRDPTEVQLYVSTDQGINWQMYGRVKPEQGHFLFRAVADGEYWFLIRTLDRSGQLRPERADGPGLRVVVDTTLPELQLQALRGEAGQIIVRWQVTEPYLDPGTLKIQYRADASRPWQSVAIDPGSVHASGSTQTGEVIWWPEFRSKVVELRAEVADTAGNLAVSHAQVELDRVALTDSIPTPETSRDLQAGSLGAAQAPGLPWRPSTDSSPPAHAVRGSPDPAPVGEVRRPAPSWTQGGPPAITASPPGSTAGQPRPDSLAAGGLSRPKPAGTNAATFAAGPPADWSPQRSVPADTNPAIGNQYVTPSQEPGAPGETPVPRAPGSTAPLGAGLLTPPRPADQRPQMVKSRLFELEYQVDSVQSAGIGRVELWGTRDGGRTWTSFGNDNDRQSPMLVTVPGEGIYGFRVAVQNGVGLAAGQPQSGDPVDVWIGVDLTRPTARILSAERGTGDQAGQMILRWEADDEMLSAQPISLSYSATPGGPWLTIARALENSGQYRWSIDRGLPQRIYLLLEAVDEAGNVGSFATSEAVSLDPGRPTARIQNVRPVLDSVRAPRRQG